MEQQMKTCRVCNENKPLDMFYLKRIKNGLEVQIGYQDRCKTCSHKIIRAYKEKIKSNSHQLRNCV